MEQKITSTFHSKWLSKLIEYDYEVCYKKGKENAVVDGLSKIPAAQLLVISPPPSMHHYWTKLSNLGWMMKKFRIL